MELEMNDTHGARRSVFEIRDENEAIFVRVCRREHDYQIRVLDLKTGDELGAVTRKRFDSALDFAHACVA